MAAVDYFLKVEGAEGESPDAKHKKEIEVESWSWGESQMGSSHSGGGAGAGKVSFQDFHFVSRIDKSSPALFLKCANGEHTKKAVLVCRKAGKEQQEYLTVTMEDVLVSSFQTGGSQGSVLPTCQVALNFSKIEFEYKEQKADGTLGGSTKKFFSVKDNKGG